MFGKLKQMDFNVSITGFTSNQIKHADVIWALTSREEVDVYLATLDTSNFIDAQIAFNMLAAETLDDVNDIDLDEVVEHLTRFTL